MQINEMHISDIMSQPIVTIEMDDSLAQVKEIFDHSKFHHLLVVEKKVLCGVISDRDLLKAISPNIGTIAETVHDAATLNKRVHQIMTRKPVTTSSAATIVDAIDIFNHEKISCIPVCDERRHPIGIVSWRDILQVLSTPQSDTSGQSTTTVANAC